jgi:erythromycin esterase
MNQAEQKQQSEVICKHKEFLFPQLIFCLFWFNFLLLSAFPQDTLSKAEVRKAANKDSAQVREDRLLEIGKLIEREISGDELHSYKFNLPTGALLRIHIEQVKDYLGLVVYGTDGMKIQEYTWAPKGADVFVFTSAAPALTIIAEPSTNYRLELRSSEKTPYTLRIEKLPDSEYKAELKRNSAATAWFARNAIPVRSITAGSGFQDLMPLRRVLRNVRVVGLGEATHGSREFFQIKHRLLEFLVKEMGFTLFGIESSYAACEKINEYVLYGKGNRNEVLAGQRYWQWNTEEVAEMIEWMREYNRTAPESKKVKFYGFDFSANDLAIETVLAYLKKVAPERVESATAALEPMKMNNPKRPTFVPFFSLNAEEKVSITARVNELFDYLSSNKISFVQSSSIQDYEKALQHARLLKQFTDTYSNPTYEEDKADSGVATRDRYMSENIERILKKEGEAAKMVVWSHNGHIKTTPYVMGYYLRKAFGKNYYAFGFSFNRGSFQALGIRAEVAPVVEEFSLGPAYQGSVGWLLNRVGKQNFAVNLRDAPKTGPAADWLTLPHAMRSIGNGYAPGNPAGYYRAPIVLNQAFDGIIFIESTIRTRPNT